MLDLSHLHQPENGSWYFQAPMGTANTRSMFEWQKPRGYTMANILLVGNGGNGGTGIIGANSLAGGGGGGCSGGQTNIRIPLMLLPDVLWLGLNPGNSTSASFVSIAPDTSTNVPNTLVAASYGATGGNGTSVPAGGAGGVAGTAITAGSMPLGWVFRTQVLQGQVGGAGGSTGNGINIGVNSTGLLVNGGGGAGGLPAAATGGNAAGACPLGTGVFPQVQPIGGSSATTPPQSGWSLGQPIPKLLYLFGGAGGGSTHGSATGAGLVQSSGGNGAPGCGGGGMGAALTGSSAGAVGLGGPAWCWITCW